MLSQQDGAIVCNTDYNSLNRQKLDAVESSFWKTFKHSKTQEISTVQILIENR